MTDLQGLNDRTRGFPSGDDQIAHAKPDEPDGDRCQSVFNQFSGTLDTKFKLQFLHRAGVSGGVDQRACFGLLPDEPGERVRDRILARQYRANIDQQGRAARCDMGLHLGLGSQ